MKKRLLAAYLLDLIFGFVSPAIIIVPLKGLYEGVIYSTILIVVYLILFQIVYINKEYFLFKGQSIFQKVLGIKYTKNKQILDKKTVNKKNLEDLFNAGSNIFSILSTGKTIAEKKYDIELENNE